MNIESIKESFAAFCKTIARLRDPKDGCSWDLKQSHNSLRPYMLEEAYEASAAMAAADQAHICEELGDVLLQVVLNAQVAADDNNFSIVDVINGINEKMIRRHPHVFDKAAFDNDGKNVEEHLTRWEQIKQAEKKQTQKFLLSELEGQLFPSTELAYKIGKKVAKVGFDWPEFKGVLDNLVSEIEELKEECSASQIDKVRIQDEIGDIYFSLAQLCRRLDIHPEVTAQDGNLKFMRRFSQLEALATQKGLNLDKISLDEKQELWVEVKSRERGVGAREPSHL